MYEIMSYLLIDNQKLFNYCNVICYCSKESHHANFFLRKLFIQFEKNVKFVELRDIKHSSFAVKRIPRTLPM